MDWPGDDDDDDDDGCVSDHNDVDDDGDNSDDDGGFGGEGERAGLLRTALHPPHQQLHQPQRQGAERAGGGLARW